jgi:hypothetical protein
MLAGAERAEITVEQVLRELAKLGFSCIGKAVTWRNELVVQRIEVSQNANGSLRIKMHDKHAALVSIGKHLGMFVDVVQMRAVYGVSDKPMSAEEWKRHKRLVAPCKGRAQAGGDK